MVAEIINGDPSREMIRTLTLATSNRSFQGCRNLLLHRIKNQHNLYIARTAASCDDDDKDDNPQKLPHLPVPDLEDTMKKYLRSVKPLLNEKDYNNTEISAENFAGPCGPANKLQDYLLKRAETHANWLEQWWLNTAYLGYRDPVTIFSSPGQSFPFESFNSEEERIDYTAKLIMAAVSYKVLIDKKKIPVDKMGKAELDMKQYDKILGTCRIPAMPIDKLEFHPKSRHIIVACNNNFFKVTAMTDKQEPISKKELVDKLVYILSSASKPGPAVGLLTAENRDNWAKTYNELMEYATNRASIKEIQSSLFLVCLDKLTLPSPDNRITKAIKQFIHGGGTDGNSANRWYDKTIQFVLSPTGEVGLTYEHSPSEGQPVAVMVDFLHNYIIKDLGQNVPDSKSLLNPIRLEFEVNDSISEAIVAAGKHINKIACNLDMFCFKFTNYGKDFVKSQKMSPDSYIQMALQSAFYKIHNKPAAHYESAATRMYIGGRTETIRSCSVESVEFAKLLLDTSKAAQEKVAALRKAVNGHKKYTIDAIQGLAVDRHLLGLRLAAADLKMKLPDFYRDPGWTTSTHMRISSSQVATQCDGLMGYAPLVNNGYGCCYNPRADDINFAVSTFSDYPNTAAQKFKDSLEWCLCEMQNVLVKSQKSKM